MEFSKYIQTEGIILNEQEYKETSKIIKVYTEELGLISLFAYGSQSPKSDLFYSTKKHSITNFSLLNEGGRIYIQSLRLIENNGNIGNNVKKFFIAEIITEIVLKTTIENYKNRNIFLLLKSFYSSLNDNRKLEYLKVGYIIKHLTFLGYRPKLSNYSKDKPIVFSYRDGGVINSYNLDSEYGEYVTTEDVKSIYNLLTTSFQDYDKLNIKNISKIDSIITKFLYYTTEISRLKSEEIYKRLHSSWGGI